VYYPCQYQRIIALNLHISNIVLLLTLHHHILNVTAPLNRAEGYSCGDPKKRYDHWASKGIWSGLFTQLIAAGVTAVQITLK
jgi:hypothetical protein